VVRIARSAPATEVGGLPEVTPVGRPRIAVAGGRAFTFEYPDNVEALAAAGAEIVPFDPLHDPALPEAVDGLVVGGGFPEVMAAELAANVPLLGDVRRRVDAGLPVWAECGGLLWLARSLDGHRLAGVVDTDGAMTDRLTLGYRRATTTVPSPLGPAGTTFRGHEFHYSRTSPGGTALDVEGRLGRGPSGFANPRLLASYVHVHLAGHADVARAFVATAAAHRRAPG
jgi:cobyrinic acid a,c-diamide synthase